MVEVVQDLFDHVTYAGGVGRRRVDSVRGFSAGTPRPGLADYALVKEDLHAPAGPQLRCLKDLMFHEMLDKPFEEKGYRAQLEEFAYRGERIIRQIDHKFGELHGLIEDDALQRRGALLPLLRETNDSLHRAHGLISAELEEVWHMRFEPFFYPSEEGVVEQAERPFAADLDAEDLPEDVAPDFFAGGWLDLGDVVLTSRLLIRYVAELVALVGIAVQQLPEEVLAHRSSLRASAPHPALRAIVAAFAARVPWIGADLHPDVVASAGAGAPTASSSGTSGRASPDSSEAGRSVGGSDGSPLNEAIATLDTVLTVHLKELSSDLHRTMYHTFVKVCAAYGRWKQTFRVERRRAADREAELQALRVQAQRRVSRRANVHQGKTLSEKERASAMLPGYDKTRRRSTVAGSTLAAAAKSLARQITPTSEQAPDVQGAKSLSSKSGQRLLVASVSQLGEMD